MDYDKLKTELTTDPLDRGYAAMTAEEAATSLNEPDRMKPRPIPSNEMLTWLGSAGRYRRLEAAADNAGLSDAVRSICKVALKLVDRADTHLDPANADHAGMIGAMVAAGVATAGEAEQLAAIGSEACSRAAELGLPRVEPGHIQDARRL